MHRGLGHRVRRIGFGETVFETATWRRHNRRNYAVMEQLSERLGLPVNVGLSADLPGTTIEDLAYATVRDVGVVALLGGSIATFPTWKGMSGMRRVRFRSASARRDAHQLWNSVTPESGGRAARFLVEAAAQLISGQYREMDQVPQVRTDVLHEEMKDL